MNLGAESEGTVCAVRAAIADDLDTPSALAAVDAWAERTLGGGSGPRAPRRGLSRAPSTHCSASASEQALEPHPLRGVMVGPVDDTQDVMSWGSSA